MFFILGAQGTNLEVVRSNFYKAIEDEQVTKDLLASLDNVTEKEPALLAYKGAAEALMAKHVFNPYSKLKYLSRSKKTLETAVDISPQDAEIRFLRFSIEHFLPSFLGYSNNLEEDKKAILENLGKHYARDRDLVKNVAEFMIQSERCTEEEVMAFKEYLN
ncbi:hypothetical protein RCC89_01205 [Cytophagaceae bacterium ABcell3]|nr:hypothetical protein RCC89_01205 [Cytophagaceae bacterium ABcell3]